MNNLVRYLKTISTTCLWMIIFTAALSSVYSFDITEERVDLTLTRFLDSLSYKYKGFDIKITDVTIGETYDDNLSFSKKDKEEDFITYAGVTLGVQYQGKTRTFELTGDIVSQTFAKNDNFDNITEHMNLNFNNEFSKRDRISISSVFTHFKAPESSSEPEEGYFSEQFGNTGGRFEFFRNKFNLAYSNDIAKQLSFSVKYTNEINVFSGTDRANSFLNKPGLGLSYIFSPTATIFTFSYEFASIIFESESDATINTIGPGIRQYITKKLYFDGAAAIDIIDTFDDENLTKPFLKASLTYIIDEKTRANISFSKRYETSYYFDDIFNAWRSSVSLTRQISKRLGCSLSTFYGEGEDLAETFKQKLVGVNSGLNYDISRNLRGNLTYTYSQSDTNDEDTGYSKNTVFLGFAAGF